MPWPMTTMGEVTENYDRLRRPVKSSDRCAGPYPYFGASGIIDYVDGYTHDGNYLLIAEDGENLRSRKTPVAFIVEGKIWVNNHAHVVQGNHFANTRFLSYVLAGLDISGYLTGSTLPKLSRSALDSILIELPPMNDQEAISSALGALDDKINSNGAAIDVAENLALTLASKVINEVPLIDLIKIHREVLTGKKLGTDAVWHYSLPAYDVNGLPSYELPGRIMSGKFALRHPGVLISKLNPRFPRVWCVADLKPGLSVTSTEFVVMEPRFGTPELLWSLLAQPRFGAALESKVAGTSGSHQRVRPDDMVSTLVGDPRSAPSRLADAVTQTVRLAQHARDENVTLAALRDALLPELMSGRMRVRDAEEQVGEVL